MTSSHRELKDLLPEYVRGELPEDAGREVEEHLAACVACRREREMVEAIARWPVPEPGADFWRALPVGAAATAPPARRRRLRPVRLALLAAAAACLLLFVHDTRRGSREERQTQVGDPLAADVWDLADIGEGDIPFASGEEEETLLGELLPEAGGGSYYREAALLSGDELDELYEALARRCGNGG